MTTVLFVHGTGVRQPGYDRALARFTVKLAKVRPASSVKACFWGAEHGARLNCDGVSIPSTGTTGRGIDVEADREIAVALWGLLERDRFSNSDCFLPTASQPPIAPRTLHLQVEPLRRSRAISRHHSPTSWRKLVWFLPSPGQSTPSSQATWDEICCAWSQHRAGACTLR